MNKLKISAALIALCLLGGLMQGPEPRKYLESGAVNPAHTAWVKRQHRDDL
jgi:hypothetical protein